MATGAVQFDLDLIRQRARRIAAMTAPRSPSLQAQQQQVGMSTTFGSMSGNQPRNMSDKDLSIADISQPDQSGIAGNSISGPPSSRTPGAINPNSFFKERSGSPTGLAAVLPHASTRPISPGYDGLSASVLRAITPPSRRPSTSVDPGAGATDSFQRPRSGTESLRNSIRSHSPSPIFQQKPTNSRRNSSTFKDNVDISYSPNNFRQDRDPSPQQQQSIPSSSQNKQTILTASPRVSFAKQLSSDASLVSTHSPRYTDPVVKTTITTDLASSQAPTDTIHMLNSNSNSPDSQSSFIAGSTMSTQFKNETPIPTIEPLTNEVPPLESPSPSTIFIQDQKQQSPPTLTTPSLTAQLKPLAHNTASLESSQPKAQEVIVEFGRPQADEVQQLSERIKTLESIVSQSVGSEHSLTSSSSNLRTSHVLPPPTPSSSTSILVNSLVLENSRLREEIQKLKSSMNARTLESEIEREREREKERERELDLGMSYSTGLNMTRTDLGLSGTASSLSTSSAMCDCTINRLRREKIALERELTSKRREILELRRIITELKLERVGGANTSTGATGSMSMVVGGGSVGSSMYNGSSGLGVGNLSSSSIL